MENVTWINPDFGSPNQTSDEMYQQLVDTALGFRMSLGSSPLLEKFRASLDDDPERSESAIQAQVLADFDKELADLADSYEIQIRQMVANIETELQKGWTAHLSNLEHKLRGTIQHKKTKRESIRIGLEEEVRINSENEAWKREVAPFLVDEIKRKIEKEFEERRRQLAKEMEIYIESEARRAKAECEREFREKTRHVKTKTDSDIRREALEELQYDKEYVLRKAAIERVGRDLIITLQNKLGLQIESEIKNTKIEELRVEALQEVEDDHTQKIERIERFYSEKISEIEKEVEEVQSRRVYSAVQERTDNLDRDVRIKYLKRQETLLKQVKEKMKKNHEEAIKKHRSVLDDMKKEVSRLKSMMNIRDKNFYSTRKKEVQMLKDSEIALEKSIRQIKHEEHFKSQYKSFNTKEKTKTTSRVPTEIKPQITENSCSHETTVKRTLLQGTSCTDFASTLILKNIEAAKQKDYISFEPVEISINSEKNDDSFFKEAYYKPPTPVKVKVQKALRESQYEALLDKYHGIIDPKR